MDYESLEKEELYDGHPTLLYDPNIYNKHLNRIHGNIKTTSNKKGILNAQYSYIKYKEDLIYVRPMVYQLKNIVENEGHLKEKTQIKNITREDKEYIDYYNSLPSAPKIYTYLGDGTKVNMWHPFGGIYLNTKYGIGYINSHGYIHIQASKNYRGKLLHRLIYEDRRGKIPEGYYIHHKDGNKLNNSIVNLEALNPYEHKQRHKKKEMNKKNGKKNS